MPKIKVTRKNVKTLRAALQALRQHRSRVLNLLRSSPVECTFDDYRFFIENTQQFDELVQAIEEELQGSDITPSSPIPAAAIV